MNHAFVRSVMRSANRLFARQRRTLYILASILFLNVGLQAQTTYYTVGDGIWSDPNIWSTDGVTPCSCVPSYTISGFSVEINNTVTIDQNVSIAFGDSLVIAPAAIVDQTGFRITGNSGRLSVYGDYTVNRIANNVTGDIYISGILTIVNGNTTNRGNITLENGWINVLIGNIRNLAGGTFSILNSLLEFQSGNLENDGDLILDQSCVYFHSGNADNNLTGTVSGDGMFSTAGTIDNLGSWDSNVDYCAGGNANGMPHAENCGNQICNQLLPLEYTAMSGRYTETGVALEWATASEENTLYFTVQRSFDGANYEDIGQVNAAGLSNSTQIYSFTDPAPGNSVAYYRVVCLDLEGNQGYSPFVRIVPMEEASGSMIVFPNPASGQTQISFDLNTDSNVRVQLFDAAGRVVRDHDLGGLTTGQHNTTIALDQLPAGYYIVSLTGSNGLALRKRLAVTR